MLDKFAEAAGDHPWIHVDVERARREMPGGVSAAEVAANSVRVTSEMTVEIEGQERPALVAGLISVQYA